MWIILIIASGAIHVKWWIIERAQMEKSVKSAVAAQSTIWTVFFRRYAHKGDSSAAMSSGN